MLSGSGTTIVLPNVSADTTMLLEGFTGILLSTSGSTGTPKTVMLSREALLAGVRISKARIGSGSWVNPLSPLCVAGIMTRVRALVSSHSHMDVSPHLDDLPAGKPGTYASLVPTQLYRGLTDPRTCRKLATYEAILVGGSLLDPAVYRQAHEKGVPVVYAYGLSETCGGVVYDGIPLDTVEVTVDNSEDPKGGRIIISTPTVFDGYLADPVRTSEVLTNGRFFTSDRGRFIDGHLTLLGRIDEVVSSGGINVDLADIQRLLDGFFPQAVACFAVPDPMWGYTVLVASTGPTLDQILDRLAAHLESPARPRGILILDDLPYTSSGKIDRMELVKRWRQGGDRSSVA